MGCLRMEEKEYHVYNIEGEASVEEVLQKIEQACEKGWMHFPSEVHYKGEEYHGICTADCLSCGVPGLIRLLKAMLQDKKEEPDHYYPDVIYGF